jgi:DNA-binding transcriptional regulator PaaX
MARGFVRKNNLTKETLLKIAAIGALTLAVSTSPYFLHRLVNAYFKDKTGKARRARAKKLREMEKHKLINFKELGNGTVRIELSHKGKNLVRQYNLENMKLQKPKHWDGQWRIVIYDIPTHQKRASNAFRQKLRQLGLFPIQRSVWVSPYECLSEIEFLATVFDIDIDRCVCYFLAKNIPREKEIKEFFSL